MPALTAAPTVCVDLPETWVPVTVAPDGARNEQRRLLEDWCQGPAPEDLLRRLTRESRDAHHAGTAFAAVLLGTVDGSAVDLPRVAVTAALTLGFRPVGQTDPRVAAEGVLQVLRSRRRPAGRLELVGLDGDPGRPAVLVQERGTQVRTEVLWLLPGTGQLAGVCVTSGDLPLAAALTDVALAVAISLRLEVSGR